MPAVPFRTKTLKNIRQNHELFHEVARQICQYGW